MTRETIAFWLALLSAVLSTAALLVRVRAHYKSRRQVQIQKEETANRPEQFRFNKSIVLDLARVNEIGIDAAIAERIQQIASLN